MTQQDAEENKGNELNEEKCPICELTEIDIAIGAAHAACRAAKEQKDQCIDWVENIDPTMLKSAEDIWLEALDRAGVEGLNKAAEAFNTGYRNAIIHKVNQLQEAGEIVPPDLMAAYKEVLRRATI